ERRVAEDLGVDQRRPPDPLVAPLPPREGGHEAQPDGHQRPQGGAAATGQEGQHQGQHRDTEEDDADRVEVQARPPAPVPRPGQTCVHGGGDPGGAAGHVVVVPRPVTTSGAVTVRVAVTTSGAVTVHATVIVPATVTLL